MFIKALIGLGNPGDAYTFTRHNVGFLVIDALHQNYSFPDFKKKYHGLFSEGLIGSQRVCLLKPTTFMNRSGNLRWGSGFLLQNSYERCFHIL